MHDRRGFDLVRDQRKTPVSEFGSKNSGEQERESRRAF